MRREKVGAMADSKHYLDLTDTTYPLSAELINKGRDILYQDLNEVAIGVVAQQFKAFLKEHNVISKQKRRIHTRLILVHPEKLCCVLIPRRM